MSNDNNNDNNNGNNTNFTRGENRRRSVAETKYGITKFSKKKQMETVDFKVRDILESQKNLIDLMSTRQNLNTMEDTYSKYKNIIEEHPFFKRLIEENDEDKISKPRVRQKYVLSPYFLMLGCFLKNVEKYKAKYELLEKCESIIEKNLSIDYDIRKKFEAIFLKKHVFNKDERTFFRFNMKSINITKPEKCEGFIDELEKEYNEKITKDLIKDVAMRKNFDLLEDFADYHTN